MNRNAPRLRILLVLTLFFEACAVMGPSLPRESCPVAPVSTGDLPQGLRLRARMSFTVGDRIVGLETVAHAVQDELVVIGLAPYGARLFTVRQRGREISVEASSKREFERLALWVMDVLHRIYWIAPPSDRQSSRVSSWNRANERVTEWNDGSLLRREFVRPGENAASSRVTISYHEDADTGESTVEIRNPWCGYKAVVATLTAVPAGQVRGRWDPVFGEATK